MGLSSDDRYLDTRRDPERIYKVIESPDGDGWVIRWHARTGTKVTIAKALGWYETVEEATAALDRAAIRNQWSYLVTYTNKFTGKVSYEWLQATEPVMAEADPEEEAFDGELDED